MHNVSIGGVIAVINGLFLLFLLIAYPYHFVLLIFLVCILVLFAGLLWLLYDLGKWVEKEYFK